MALLAWDKAACSPCSCAD
uniref:Uncharacterized protein n=1 Tax=Anguilla anguilla TaxID=7936 RepID=A0A0E9TPT7_ANGAN